jgi:hypothetical protein
MADCLRVFRHKPFQFGWATRVRECRVCSRKMRWRREPLASTDLDLLRPTIEDATGANARTRGLKEI